jgi:hypothetical protein
MQVTSFFYYNLPHLEDAYIKVEGTQSRSGRESAEFWGAPISWSSSEDGEVDSIEVSADYGDTWRDATQEEYDFLHDIALEKLDAEEIEEFSCLEY